jgi:hypothetical protein
VACGRATAVRMLFRVMPKLEMRIPMDDRLAGHQEVSDQREENPHEPMSRRARHLIKSRSATTWRATSRNSLDSTVAPKPSLAMSERSTTSTVLFVYLFALSGAFAPAAAQPSTRPSIRAVSATAAPRLDGRLDDVAWRQADSVTSFTQTEPKEGAAGSATTVLRILTTPDALYIGIRAAAPVGIPIVAFARDRDAAMANEDHVKIVVQGDTRQPERSAHRSSGL